VRLPSPAAFAAFAAALLAATSARAWVISEDPLEGKSLDIGGTVRSFDYLMHGGLLTTPLSPPDENPAGTSLLALRAKLDWEASEHFRLVIHDELTTTLSSLVLDQAGPLALGQGKRAPVWLPLQADLASSSRVLVHDTVDWLYARWSTGPVQMTFGRQPVTLGRGVLWTPMDLLAPFSPIQIDTEFKPGVDALRSDVRLGDAATVTMLGVLGRSAGADDFKADAAGSAELAHLELRFGSTRIGAMGGLVRQDVVGGLDGFYDLGHGADLHGAVTVTYVPQAERRTWGETAFVRAVLGSTFELGKKVHATVEAFYNGSGAPDSSGYLTELGSPRFAVGEEYDVGRYYAGATVDWQPHPLVHVGLAALMNLQDPSALLSPQIRYDLAKNTLLVAGAFLPIGAQPTVDPIAGLATPSEFGLYPFVYHVDLKVYF
jgi:hypothetical protein